MTQMNLINNCLATFPSLSLSLSYSLSLSVSLCIILMSFCQAAVFMGHIKPGALCSNRCTRSA